MNYEKLHKDTITKLQEMVNSGKITAEIARGICADFVPESEDERIREKVITTIHLYYGEPLEDEAKEMIAWLEKQENKDSQVILPNILWHDGNEEPEEQCEILCEWESNDAVWHDVAFYHADTKTFWNGAEKIEAVVRWIYVNEILEKQGEKGTNGNEREIPNSEQKPTKWSEEDEYLLGKTIQCLEEFIRIAKYCGIDVQSYQRDIDWLKSLKDRVGCEANCTTTWKPSDEQMLQLGWIAKQNEDNMIGKELRSLYQDLKKLRGK